MTYVSIVLCLATDPLIRKIVSRVCNTVEAVPAIVHEVRDGFALWRVVVVMCTCLVDFFHHLCRNHIVPRVVRAVHICSLLFDFNITRSKQQANCRYRWHTITCYTNAVKACTYLPPSMPWSGKSFGIFPNILRNFSILSLYSFTASGNMRPVSPWSWTFLGNMSQIIRSYRENIREWVRGIKTVEHQKHPSHLKQNHKSGRQDILEHNIRM